MSGSRGRGKYGRGETLGSKRRTPLSVRPNGSAIRPQPLLCPKVRKHDQASEPVLYRDPHRSSGIRCQTRCRLCKRDRIDPAIRIRRT
nr:MAG TPA: hypothetical protein [Caudoviricetes sp.]